MQIFGFRPPAPPEIVIFFARGDSLWRNHPFRQSLRLCHLPQGDGFSGGGKVTGQAVKFTASEAFPRSGEGGAQRRMRAQPRETPPVISLCSMPAPSEMGLLTWRESYRVKHKVSAAGANPLRLTAFASSPERGSFSPSAGKQSKLPPSGEVASRSDDGEGSSPAAPRFRRKRRCSCRLPSRPLP